jgi:hypothetical protein
MRHYHAQRNSGRILEHSHRVDASHGHDGYVGYGCSRQEIESWLVCSMTADLDERKAYRWRRMCRLDKGWYKHHNQHRG